MDAMFVGEGDELTLEREQLRPSEPAENIQDDEEAEEHSEGVVSRLVFCTGPERRCGNGAVLRLAEGSLLRDGTETGTSVTGLEVGLGLWKACKCEVDARTEGWCTATCVNLELLWIIRDG